MTVSRAAILLLIALAIFQYVHYQPVLPDPVATHFNGAGIPNGWSSKSAFLTGNLVMTFGFAALFLGLTGFVRKIPDPWINMPNKDYWLAPERRARTLAQLQAQMEGLGAATLALLLGITQLSIEANLAGRPMDNRTFWILFGAYMAGALVWLVVLLRWSFRRPPQNEVGR